MADPFDINEEKVKIGIKLLKILAELKYPTIFSTKGILPMKGDYYKLFKKYKENKTFIFQFSIITNSDFYAREFEPLAPSTTARLECMQAMSDLGYYTILRLRPYIIGLTDKDIELLIKRASEAGAQAISVEFLCLDARMNTGMKKRYELMSKYLDFNIYEYFKALSPSERGGYMRLNKKVKAEHIETLLTLCKKYNLAFNISDPDFKELNQSSCCCGIPDNYPNFNFSRAQLTHLLIKARKLFIAGKPPLVYFSDLIKEDETKWLDEPDYYGDSLKLWNSDYSCKGKNFKREFLQVWNNLNSPENPYNYFHGTLKPHSYDSNNNLVFEHQPTSYEKKWMKQGILK